MRKHIVVVLTIIMVAALMVPSVSAIWHNKDGAKQGMLVGETFSSKYYHMRIKNIDPNRGEVEIRVTDNLRDDSWDRTIEVDEPYEIGDRILIELERIYEEDGVYKVDIIPYVWIHGDIREAFVPEDIEIEDTFNVNITLDNDGFDDAPFRIETTTTSNSLRPVKTTQVVQLPPDKEIELQMTYFARRTEQDTNIVVNLYFEDDLIDTWTIRNVEVRGNASGYIEDVIAPERLVVGKRSDIYVTLSNQEDVSKEFNLNIIAPSMTLSNSEVKTIIPAGKRVKRDFAVTPTQAGTHKLVMTYLTGTDVLDEVIYDMLVTENEPPFIETIQAPPSIRTNEGFEAVVHVTNNGITNEKVTVRLDTDGFYSNALEKDLSVSSGSSGTLTFGLSAIDVGEQTAQFELYDSDDNYLGAESIELNVAAGSGSGSGQSTDEIVSEVLSAVQSDSSAVSRAKVKEMINDEVRVLEGRVEKLEAASQESRGIGVGWLIIGMIAAALFSVLLNNTIKFESK